MSVVVVKGSHPPASNELPTVCLFACEMCVCECVIGTCVYGVCTSVSVSVCVCVLIAIMYVCNCCVCMDSIQWFPAIEDSK